MVSGSIQKMTSARARRIRVAARNDIRIYFAGLGVCGTAGGGHSPPPFEAQGKQKRALHKRQQAGERQSEDRRYVTRERSAGLSFRQYGASSRSFRLRR